MQKIERSVLIFFGGMLTTLSLMWDVMKGNPFNIESPQIVGSVLGICIAVLGIQPSRVIRINFYILSALLFIGMFVLELVLPKSFSKTSLTIV